MTASQRRKTKIALGVVATTLLLLLIPDCSEQPMQTAQAEPFVWGEDALWESLESRFNEVREQGCAQVRDQIAGRLGELEQKIGTLEPSLEATNPRWDEVEAAFFQSAAEVAACPSRAPQLANTFSTLRQRVKAASVDWELDEDGRRRLYRLLYGGRMAVEEVLLQMPDDEMPVLMRGADEPSEAPSAEVHGIRVHSGDMLVSRGGAPTSALIARGNDYPGNFSHVALVHVDEGGQVRTIESHIEVGVVVAGVEAYFEDPKLRIMLLRPRQDVLPSADAAHQAATAMLERAQSEHIPYDFAMDSSAHDELFCSEVASAAYESIEIALWDALTTTSSQGTARWLSAFGVEHAQTHGPSDLEYDPKLVVVAEWRNPQGLFGDHIDDAVSDALLARAANGEAVGHSWYMLPVARVLKGYSLLKNTFGAAGPIPEGMSATVALRVDWLRSEHQTLRAKVEKEAEDFRRGRGYRPPFWRLVAMAQG